LFVAEITGRKKSAEALRAGEELLQMSLSGARAGAWRWNLLTQEVTWSPEIYDLLGLPRETEPSFGAFLELIDPAERQAILTRFAEDSARGGPFELEFRVRRDDGAEMWLSSVGRVVHDAEGKPVLASGINQDITARRQAERQREEARRTLQLVLEIAQAGVWEWNVVDDRVRGDESLARLFHLPVAEVIAGSLPAKEFFRAIHREDRLRVDQRLREVFATGGDYEIEYRIVHAQEPVRWLASRGRGDLGPGGRVTRLTGLVSDITERKQAELNSRFLLDLAAGLASLADPAEIEQAAVDRLGAHLEVGRCYFAQIAGNRAAVLNEYRQGGGGILGEYELDEYYSAEAREQLTQGVPLVADDVETDPRTAASAASFAALGIGAVIIMPVKYQHRWVSALCCVSRERRAWRADELHLMQDLTARVWPLIEQARASQALRDADRRKDEFLAMLAHELRNPLAPIRNAAQVLKLVGSADAHQQWAREVIERQTQHLMRLVDDLLDVSRITQGKVTLAREPLELATILQRAVEASRPLIDARRHQLTVELPPDPVRLEGDLTRLVQVVGNLLNNAAKYTDEGGDLRLEGAQEDGEAVIRVRDNGMGVPADLLPHVFDLFTQADRSLDRSQGGLGIGLTLVRRLVELHGGRVEARSGGSGQGSEFIVRLPAEAPLGTAAEAMAGAEGEPALPAPQGLKILVVEDNVDSAEMMRFMLELAGHEVRTAYDGREALETARTFQPQAVLCDIGLPGMNGYEVAARLREQPAFQRTPLIALTGYGQEEARRRAEAAGFDHHLVKPVEPDALGELLDSLRGNGAGELTLRNGSGNQQERPPA
jgi:PAS domain S-box-containing protein